MPEEGINREVPQGQHMVGTWHTFVSKTQRIIHPMDENALDNITLKAIDTVVNMDP